MSARLTAPHRWLWLEQLAHDVRYALRTLRRSPAFTASTVLTLAVGLALVTVVFTVFNAYVLRPFAVRDPHALHVLGWEARDAQGWRFSLREFEELRARSDLFEDVSAERTQFVKSGGRQLSAGFVSGNYFDMLGARVSLGRPIAAVDLAAPRSAPVAVLSDDAWARLYGRDPGVIGRTIEANRESLVIVGVMRPQFSGLDDSPRDLWIPLTMIGAVGRTDVFGPGAPREVVLTARLRRGVTARQAQGALTPFMTLTSGRSDAVRASLAPRATPAPLSFELLVMLAPVFAAFLLVLVAACANVSNVMLARANARQREIGVRLSLGASRGRLVRQLLTEGFMIAGLSGLVGLGIAGLMLRAGPPLFFAMLPPSVGALMRVVRLDFDHRVFMFSVVSSSAVALMFALLPALHATRGTLIHALRGHAALAVRSSTLRGMLVTSQVTVSLVILIAAATLVRNGMALDAIDLGFEANGAISIRQHARGAALTARTATLLAGDPHVETVAVTSVNPLFEQVRQVPVTPAGTANSVAIRYTFVSPEYFPLLRIPIVRGRTFSPDEAEAEAHVGIVSAATARALWPGEDPIGKTLRIEHQEAQSADKLPAPGSVVIVGVARDVVSGFVYDGEDRAHLYMPTNPDGVHAAAVLVRGRGPAEFRRGPLPAVLERVHEDPFAFEVLPLTEVLALQMFPLRVASSIGFVLAAIAMTLSVSGLYGVLTYMLTQRTREIGIRMALGATPGRVLGLVMRQCGQLAGGGVALGVVVAFITMKLFNSVIEMRNVSIVDAGSFAAGVALIAAASAIAAYVPARRATRVEPSQALRAEG